MRGKIRSGWKTWMLGVVVACIVAANASAAIDVHVWKDPQLYGNLNQHDVDSDWGDVACVPTAMVNSFVYLQNAYPNVYDNLLIPDLDGDGDLDDYDDMITVARTLADYMDLAIDVGVYPGWAAYGKQKYLEEVAPGKTIYHGQSVYGWRTAPGSAPSWFEVLPSGLFPTWEFIYGQLADCEDVEIFVYYTSGGGHALTLTSFYWDDDGDNVIEQGEAGIDYIDPLTGLWADSSIWHGSDGRIETSFGGGSWIGVALAESPVPAPGALLLGMIGVALVRLVRGKAA